MESWALFTGDGNELSRGVQMHSDKARAWAQSKANELDTTVELVSELAIREARESDEEANGEVFEPESGEHDDPQEVITWAAGEHSINISVEAETILTAAGIWPRTRGGAEYCQVKRGRHLGFADIDSDKARKMVAAKQA